MEQETPAKTTKFARNPVGLTRGRILDYENDMHVSIYYKGVKELSCAPFDGTDLPSFLIQFGHRASEFYWMPILTFNQGKNLIRNYGAITREEVKSAASEYLKVTDRRAQDSFMMLTCLKKSIKSEIYAKVALTPEHYSFDVDGEEIEDGPCFLKAIIDCCYPNSRYHAPIARKNLAALPRYMKRLKNSDISAFNQYVRTQLQALEAESETSTHLLENLLDGYEACKDERFRHWIEEKRADWMLGKLTINGLELMNLAENYYRVRLQSGQWLVLNEELVIKKTRQEVINAFQDALKMEKGDKKGKRDQAKK